MHQYTSGSIQTTIIFIYAELAYFLFLINTDKGQVILSLFSFISDIIEYSLTESPLVNDVL